MIIAIDGSAASGKGTLAKAVAKHLKYDHLDTGALYRALALSLINTGQNTENFDKSQIVKIARNLDLALTQSPLIRSEEVAGLASRVAAIGPVRTQLLALQRHFAESASEGRGAVLDGRDIGTIVMPDADIKFFVDARIEVRALRRTKELLQSGQSAMFRDVLADMQARDDRDRNRSVAPLRAADDAITIDTSDIDAETVVALALKHIKALALAE